MVGKSKKKLNKIFLLILLIAMMSVSLTIIISNIPTASADVDYKYTVLRDKDYWKDNFSWKNMLRPKYTTCSIKRTGVDTYTATTSVYMAYANLGVGWWEIRVYVDDKEITYKGFENAADKDHTWTVNFTHSDKKGMKVKFKVLSNYGVTTVENTSSADTLPAYDTQAPSIKLNTEEDSYTNQDVIVEATDNKTTPTIQVSHDGGDWQDKGEKVTLTEEGAYKIRARDKSGNMTTERSFNIDKTKPKVTSLPEYTNQSFIYSVIDANSVTIKYRKNGGSYTEIKAKSFTVPATIDNNGTWEFEAVDIAGNSSGKTVVKLYKREDNYGNIDNIENGYKVPTWYTVRLPERVYDDCYGEYSFGTYDYALDFAIKKEWEYRVVEYGNGKWAYVNIGNESVSQVYTDKESLDEAVQKYAESYISERNIFDGSANNYPNPTDKDGISSPDALNMQNVKLPAHLEEYAAYPRYYISHTYAFTKTQEGIAGNTISVTMRYISDGLQVQNGKEITIPYGVQVKKALEDNNAWKQGYYLVTEQDRAGNIMQYLVCLDTGAPTLTASILLGNGTQETVIFDEAYIKENENVMLYITFDIQSLVDSIDDCVFISINGRGIDYKKYIAGDALPVLTYENGYWGAYDITVYDRSLNKLQFSVRIAGEAPSSKYSSLTSETRCVLSILNGDPGNALTSVELFKVSFDGVYNKLMTDDDGTLVSPATYQYVLRKGGKYVLRFTDVFGRVIETEPLFYMKGLPSGTLKGVKENSATNRDVSFEYNSDCSVKLYEWVSGAWVESLDMVIEDKEYYFVASIAASVDTSKLYKIFLYQTDDMNLFVEYRFEIDCIAPNVTLKTSEDKEIQKETVTSESFLAWWEESDITVYYYRLNDPMGSMGEVKYTKGILITKGGSYRFTAYDKVGNKSSFTIALDNTVDYTIDGTYQILSDGSIISKLSLVLSVSERTVVWECDSSNGIEITNGAIIDTDGTYKLHIEDAYGNELNLTVIIDNLPPMPTITTENGDTVEINGIANEGIRVSCDEQGVVITVAMQSNKYQPYNGELLTEEMTYAFKMIDRMNNSLTFTVTVDKRVSFEIVGNYIETESLHFLSKGNIVLNILEKYSRLSISSVRGNSFDLGEKINAEDVYTVEVEDMAGNTTVIIIEIDKTPPRPTIKLSNGTEYTGGQSVSQSFSIACDEDNTKITYSLDDKNYTVYNGEIFDTEGRYYFVLTDRVGNSVTCIIDYDCRVNFTINGIYKQDDSGRYISRSGLTVDMKEEYKRFEVYSTNGFEFIPGEKVTFEGEYMITVEDMAGNVDTFVIVIDYTAPQVRVVADSGSHIEQNSVCNTGFTLYVEETGALVQISTNGSKYELYDGKTLSSEGKYYITATDLIGNTVSFTVTIDKTVRYEVKGSTGVYDGNQYYGRYHLILSGLENVTVVSVSTLNDSYFALDEKIIQEDTYTVTLRDEVGNETEVVLVIDKTAPIVTLQGVDEANTSNTEVTINTSDYESAKYKLTGSSEWIDMSSETVIAKEGSYIVMVKDRAGNETSVTFVIDKTVAITPSQPLIMSGQYLSNDISFDFGERMSSVVLTKDGVEVGYSGGNICDPGKYVLTANDKIGNVARYEWELLPTAAKEYQLSIPSGYTVIATSGGNTVNVVKDGKVVLNTDGKYMLTFTSENSEYSVLLQVDTVAPTVDIDQQKDKVIITNPSKNNVTMLLYCDGKEVDFSLGREITQAGEYRLVLTDELGNTAEYTFELRYINVFGIIIISIGVSAIIAIAVTLIVLRAKQRVH